MIKIHKPTIQGIKSAQKVFKAREPRDLFYRAAIDLVDLSIHGKTSLSVGEALAVLLLTWNKAFYQYNKINKEKHLSGIENVLSFHQQTLLIFRKRSIESFCDKDEIMIKNIFESFQKVVGPVGTAKCLHLLAQHFFPLWDRAIAKVYGLPITHREKNAKKYLRFMQITKEQCKKLYGKKVTIKNPLKAIDEYNYCKHTKGWI